MTSKNPHAGPKGNKTFGPVRQIAIKPNERGSFKLPYDKGREKPSHPPIPYTRAN